MPSRKTKSAPTLSRRSKSKSRSWSRSKANRVSNKADLRRIGREKSNVGKVFNYNGLRLKLNKEDVIHYEQFQGPSLVSKAVWVIGGDLKIQLS
tara:strand:- start:505 stop:786 length:282 start_codon:yes stop_codon:yes gene_type:complete